MKKYKRLGILLYLSASLTAGGIHPVKAQAQSSLAEYGSSGFEPIPSVFTLSVCGAFRKAVLIRQIRIDEAIARLGEKKESLDHQISHNDDQADQDKISDSRSRIESVLEHSGSEKELLIQWDHHLMERQSRMASTLPEQPDKASEEVREIALQAADSVRFSSDHDSVKDDGHSLYGYGASSSGARAFGRACPAYEYEEFEEGEGSASLMMPVNGYLSAGTWAYASGEMHLGMDLAAPMYSNLVAPADGIIVYANVVTGDGGGYLGNWIGWPYGGGNTIAMVAEVDGTCYGITFCHLSSRILVRAGQQVRQGQVIAKTGNTGNSTGPHTHVELFRIRTDFKDAVQYFSQTADFAFGCGWSTPGSCSQLACRIRPEKHFQK